MPMPRHHSLWRDLSDAPSFPPLRGSHQADVVIVGAGIAGVTAAWHLARAGQRVILLDMASPGSGETGKTTSHLTAMMDGGTAALIKKHGNAVAAQVVAAHQDAMAFIAAGCARLGAACRFARVPAYLYSESADGVGEVDREVAALRSLGIGVERLDAAPVPFPTAAALRIEAQAQVDPLPYLALLLREVVAAGGQVFGQSRVHDVDDGTPCRVTTDEGAVTASHVLLTCHTPPNRLAYHTQIYAYRTYAVSGPSQLALPPGLFFDTADPYHYVRSQPTPAGDVLIVGGNDHKTGKRVDTTQGARDIADYARSHFGVEEVQHAWSGQVLEPADGLPFIGLNGGDRHTLFASGFSGNGITFGTVAGGILADLVCGRENPYAKTFHSRRLDIAAQLPTAARENLDVPVHMVGDRVAAALTSSTLPAAGDGKVVQRGLQTVAVYRDAQGKVHERSAVCPHLGCLVNWNPNEKSWDCPCHGSRFSGEGQLLNGPAVSDLKALG